ncbi:hypothetical protein [Bradyrhizobium cenepequi]
MPNARARFACGTGIGGGDGGGGAGGGGGPGGGGDGGPGGGGGGDGGTGVGGDGGGGGPGGGGGGGGPGGGGGGDGGDGGDMEHSWFRNAFTSFEIDFSPTSGPKTLPQALNFSWSSNDGGNTSMAVSVRRSRKVGPPVIAPFGLKRHMKPVCGSPCTLLALMQ